MISDKVLRKVKDQRTASVRQLAQQPVYENGKSVKIVHKTFHVTLSDHMRIHNCYIVNHPEILHANNTPINSNLDSALGESLSLYQRFSNATVVKIENS